MVKSGKHIEIYMGVEGGCWNIKTHSHGPMDYAEEPELRFLVVGRKKSSLRICARVAQPGHDTKMLRTHTLEECGKYSWRNEMR